MRIIETCPSFRSDATSSTNRAEAACVSDPLHAIVGSWLGPVVEPLAGPGGPAPRPAAAVGCDDFTWR